MVMCNNTESLRSQNDFHIADYTVFGIAIFISLGIGVFHGFLSRRKNNTDEYLVGGRSMSILPTAISLVASFESSIMMLGNPAEGYNYGIQSIVGSVTSGFANTFAAMIFVPLIHPLRITSAYEYLELRFNSRAIRLVGTALGILSSTTYMGIVLFGPAVALRAVSGYPVVNTIVAVTAVAVVYTSIGGIKAVIWTDVFQALVMFAGVLAVLIQATVKVGGPKQVWDTAEAGGRINFFNFDPDPTVRHTFWNLVCGSFVRGSALIFNQSSVQRICSIESGRGAKRMIQWAAPAFVLTLSIALYEGIVAYAYHQHKGCDPMASGQIDDMNQIIPFTVMDMFSEAPGMLGLFIAALFCASLSTLSSALAGSAALAWADIIQPLVGNISESRSTIIVKFTVIIVGGIAMCVAFMVAQIGGPLSQIAGSLISSSSAPVAGLFLLGCFSPRSNAKGAMVGAFICLVVCATIAMGQSFSKNIPKAAKLPPASTDKCFAALLNQTNIITGFSGNVTYTDSCIFTSEKDSTVNPPSPQGIEVIFTISYQYIAPIGTFGTILIGYLASFFFGMNKPGDVDPRYILSISDSLLFFLPGPARRWIGSIGPQFMEDKYRANGDEKIQKSTTGVDMELKVAVISESSVNGTIRDEHVSTDDSKISYRL